MDSGLPLIYKMIKTMMPGVRSELERWRRLAERIPDTELRKQALASLAQKSFHCLGGGVYALVPHANFENTLKFIVAFQTISDYLDNLCDRAGVYDEAAFLRLHLAMADAVNPDMPQRDYYEFYPHREEGYLNGLVRECRKQARALKNRESIREGLTRLIGLYSSLQAYKHVDPALREERLEKWAKPLAAEYQGISPWEFCAATGSTLGVFLLVAMASSPQLKTDEVSSLLRAYFPWVCGVHILLDYFIDAEEDRLGGDFNFTSRYRDGDECAERLSFFAREAMRACANLRRAGFHRTVVRGLLAMYLSDPKAGVEGNRRIAARILNCGGARAQLYCRTCKALRKRGKL